MNQRGNGRQFYPFFNYLESYLKYPNFEGPLPGPGYNPGYGDDFEGPLPGPWYNPVYGYPGYGNGYGNGYGYGYPGYSYGFPGFGFGAGYGYGFPGYGFRNCYEYSRGSKNG